MTRANSNNPEELHGTDLRRMIRHLNLLIRYLPNNTGECRQKINDAIEVVQGMSDLWTRQAAQRRRTDERNKRKDR